MIKTQYKMKKAILTISIILGMTLCASAQWGGGLFQRGAVTDEEYYGAGYRDDNLPLFYLPSDHGSDDDVSAPLGGGALLLIGFGAAYAVKKRQKQ